MIRTSVCTRIIGGFCLAALIIVGIPGAGGQPGETQAKTADQRQAAALKAIINKGASLYNNDDRKSCYYLFLGALLALKPQCEGRADLLKMIDDGIASADQQPSIGNRAWTLFETLLDLREKFDPTTKRSRPIVTEERGKLDEDKIDKNKAETKSAEKMPETGKSENKKSEVENEAKIDKKASANEDTGNTATVAGFVTLDGKPIADVEVRIYPRGNAQDAGYSSITDVKGDYEFLNIKPGDYVAIVKKTAAGPVVPERYGDKDQSALTIKVVTGMQSINLELQSVKADQKSDKDKKDR